MADNIHHIVTRAVIEGNFDFIHTALDSDGNAARRNDQRVAASAQAWRYNYKRERQQDFEIAEMVRRINEAREKREEEANK